MSTEITALEQAPTPVDTPLTMKDLAALLVKHYGLRQGAFELLVEYQLGAGPVGPDKEHLSPGLMIGISKVGLMSVAKSGPTTVDASVVNPSKARRKS